MVFDDMYEQAYNFFEPVPETLMKPSEGNIETGEVFSQLSNNNNNKYNNNNNNINNKINNIK